MTVLHSKRLPLFLGIPWVAKPYIGNLVPLGKTPVRLQIQALKTFGIKFLFRASNPGQGGEGGGGGGERSS